MEGSFSNSLHSKRLDHNIHNFRTLFFELDHEKRTQKHVADPLRGSAAKRINMFLRWMVRDSKHGVDFGLWKQLTPAQLSLSIGCSQWKCCAKLRTTKTQTKRSESGT